MTNHRSTLQILKVALIGCGAVSELLYAQVLRSLEQKGKCRIIALVDPAYAQLEKMGLIFPSAARYGDLNAMFTGCPPDLAIIAAPHQFHVDLVLRSLQGGSHVLCEKPLAISTSDCERMVTAAEHANRLLAVGLFRRFFPSCEVVKALLDCQLFGPVRSFRFLEGESYSWPAQSASFFRREEAGGGVLIDAGAHTIDLLLWWLGDVDDLVYLDDAMGGVEANCLLKLKMASGANGIVQLSRDWPLPNRYRIECEHGWIAYICDVVDRVEWGFYGCDYGFDAEIRRLAIPTVPRLKDLGSAVPGFMDCFEAQLRNLFVAIQGREELRVPGTEARRSVALIERCYRERRLLPMPWLDLAEQAKAEELSHG